MFDHHKITVNDIIESAGPATKLAWMQAMAAAGPNCAIRPQFYQGTTGALGYQVSVLGQAFFALEIAFYSDQVNQASPPKVTIYNELAQIAGYAICAEVTYGTALNYMGTYRVLENILFTRLQFSSVSYMKAIGFHLIYR